MAQRSERVIVIVAYHNTRDLEACLASLDEDEEVIVVDNGAENEVKELVERRGQKYTTPGNNVGFAAAVNLALMQRDGRDVLLLNPDARVTSADVSELHSELRSDPSIAVVAPRLRGTDGRSQRVVWPMPSPREAWIDALKLRRLLEPRRVFLAGAVLFLRDEAIVDVGLFDERFFLYAEEADWQLRALKRGWRVHLDDAVTAEHSGAASSEIGNVREARFHRSASLFALKWYGRWGWTAMRCAAAAGSLFRLIATVGQPDRRAHYARLLRISATERPDEY
jgi:GT2 family glycosyltransferase